MKAENKYYKGYTEAARRYQKSEKYKQYRRKYEAGYRQNNRTVINLTALKSVRKAKGKPMTKEEEVAYLMKRMK